MDIASAVLIAFGAVIGVLMLIDLIKGHHVPKALSFIHGGLEGIGLLLLILFNLSNPEFSNWTSVVLFILASFGGVYILMKDIKHQKVPLPVVFVHGGIAVAAFLLMALKIYNNH